MSESATREVLDQPMHAPGYRAWMMTLLVAVYASSSLDRLIIAVLGPAIKADLRISDLQFGLLGGIAFAFLYTAFGIPVARLADRRNRIVIVSIATAVWSAMTALCGLAANFTQLLLLRIGVGLGEAGCSPPCYSLISDQYPPRMRAGAIAILGLGVPLGSMVGAFLGGWASEFISWRSAFVMAGLPGLLLAALVFFTLKEPARGMFDPVASRIGTPPTFGAVLRAIAAKPAFLHLTAAAALCIFCNLGLNLFIPTFLVRSHGLSYSQAGFYFGLVTGISAAIGTTGLGLLIARLARRDVRWYGWGPALVLVAGAPFYILGLVQTDFAAGYGLILASSCIGFAFLGPSIGATQNMMEPRMRASAAAVLLFAMHMVGGGLGPTFMGWASDLFAARAFGVGYAASCPSGLAPVDASSSIVSACNAASEEGLRYALVACALFFFWAAFHAYMATRTMARDLMPAVPQPVQTPALSQEVSP